MGFKASDSNFYVGTTATLGAHGVYMVNGTDGTWSSVSDQRLKTNIQTLTPAEGLAAIDQLNPVTFNWRDTTSATTTQFGLIAQQVQQVFPEFVSSAGIRTITLSDGSTTTIADSLGLNYTGFITPLIKAVQEIANLADTFKNTLIAWLADANNGIGDLFATTIHADNGDFRQVNTQTLCVKNSDGTPVCINGDQLAAVLGNANQTANGSSVPSSTSTPDTTPPTIIIDGDNPASIHVGDSYADLGATAKDTQGHDLDVRYFLNGALVSNIVIDTSAAATDTIDYVATDQAGNTATSTRSVIVEETTSTTQ